MQGLSIPWNGAQERKGCLNRNKLWTVGLWPDSKAVISSTSFALFNATPVGCCIPYKFHKLKWHYLGHYSCYKYRSKLLLPIHNVQLLDTTHLPSLSMMLTVTGPPTNKAGGATLPVRVKFSVPSTRRSSRMSTKMISPLLVPSANVSSVWYRIKSRPTARER